MRVGTVFFIVAMFFFFLAGVGSIVIPNPLAWGLLALCLGLLLNGIAFSTLVVRRQ